MNNLVIEVVIPVEAVDKLKIAMEVSQEETAASHQTKSAVDAVRHFSTHQMIRLAPPSQRILSVMNVVVINTTQDAATIDRKAETDRRSETAVEKILRSAMEEWKILIALERARLHSKFIMPPMLLR